MGIKYKGNKKRPPSTRLEGGLKNATIIFIFLPIMDRNAMVYTKINI